LGSTYDAVGPSSAGTSSAGSTSLSWSHTVGAGVTSGAMMVGIAVGVGTDTGFNASVTCATVPMNQIGLLHSANSTQGFVAVFGLTGISPGANAIAVSVSGGTPDDIAGGSLSFSGVDQTTPFGTPYLACPTANTSAPTISVTGNTNGNVIAGFCCFGHALSGITTGTSRYLIFVDPNTRAGCAAGATTPATGGTDTITWSASGTDSTAVIAVEVLGSFTGIHPIGYPVNTHSATGTVAATWGAGQNRASGNLLAAVVGAAGSTSVGTTSTATSGWSQAAGFGIEQPNAATAHARAALWTKVAAGTDAAPTFTCAASGTAAMDVMLFELNGANTTTPIDTSGVYASGTASATLSTLSATTTGNVTAAGEYAVSVFAQERAAADLIWTDTGSGNFGQELITNHVSSVLATSVGAVFPPASGATLNDAGHFTTTTTAYGAGIVAVFGTAAAAAAATAYPMTRGISMWR